MCLLAERADISRPISAPRFFVCGWGHIHILQFLNIYKSEAGCERWSVFLAEQNRRGRLLGHINVHHGVIRGLWLLADGNYIHICIAVVTVNVLLLLSVLLQYLQILQRPSVLCADGNEVQAHA